MWFRSLCNSLFFSLLATPLAIASIAVTSAQVMGSNSYQIQSDSVNFGGGYSSSTNYQQESTFGEVATGVASSDSYNLYAGYQQMQAVTISLTGATNVTLTPSLGGVSGGESNGSTTVTVVTDSSGGYELRIKASHDPAMQSNGNTIADYSPTGDPDFTFSYDSNEALFGYTPEGSDIVQRFQDSVGACNSAGGDTGSACWDGLTTTDVAIASDIDANHPLGATTSVRFRVGIGSSVNQTPGTYVATTTLTAIAL